MIKNIVLIDADSLCYLGKTEDTLVQIIEKVDYKIQAILDETQADYYSLFISRGGYFRHALKTKSEEFGSYKANRTYTSQKYAWAIKEYLIAQYNATACALVEADDLCAYWMNNKEKLIKSLNFNIDLDSNVILAAVDKDLLQSIPGKHLNYNKKFGADEWRMEWIETSESETNNFKRMQMVVGDSSDGILALKGKGIKYWEKLSAKVLPSWGEILQLYCVDYGVSQGVYEFQKNYRLLHLLETDEDFKREVGYIPELPTFLEVDKPKSIESEF